MRLQSVIKLIPILFLTSTYQSGFAHELKPWQVLALSASEVLAYPSGASESFPKYASYPNYQTLLKKRADGYCRGYHYPEFDYQEATHFRVKPYFDFNEDESGKQIDTWVGYYKMYLAIINSRGESMKDFFHNIPVKKDGKTFLVSPVVFEEINCK